MFRFNLDASPKTSAEIIANTELIKISVEAKDAALASNLTNKLAEILVTKGEGLANQNNDDAQNDLQKQLKQLQTDLTAARGTYDRLVAQSPNNVAEIRTADQGVQEKRDAYKALQDQVSALRVRSAIQAKFLSIVDPATVPLAPSKPNKLLNTLLGLLLGLVAGIGLAFLLENLDGTLHSVEQIEAVTQLATLGKIPAARHVKWPAVIMNSNSPQEEAFTRLRAKVLTMTDTHTCPTLLVTSAERGEGKSTVAANLAVSVAKLGRSVIIIDCNLHNPSLHQIFNLPNAVGLSDILQKRVEVSTDLQISTNPGFRVIISGSPYARSADLLTKERLQPFIDQLKPHADLILLDGPAFLAATDAVALSAIADGVILVVGQTIGHQDAVQTASRELGDITTKLLGVVANRVSASTIYYRA